MTTSGSLINDTDFFIDDVEASESFRDKVEVFPVTIIQLIEHYHHNQHRL